MEALMLFPILTEQDTKLPYYIKGIGTQASQEPTFRPEGFFDYQWMLSVKGRGQLKIAGRDYVLEPHMGVFFSPHIPHSYHALEEPWVTHWITFNGSYIETLLDIFNLHPWEIFNLSNSDIAVKLFKHLSQQMQADNLNKVIELSGHLYPLLLDIKHHKLSSSLTLSPPSYSKLKPVITYMESHYDQDITLEELSGLIAVSTHYLCKLFKAAFGMSPIHYLIRIRLQVAKQRLITSPHLQIQEIAHQVCYHDVSYFCKIFKRQEKVSPVQFRKLHGIN